MKAWLKGGLIGFVIGFVSLIHFGFLLVVCFESNPFCRKVAFTQWFNPASYVFRFLNIFGDTVAYSSYLFMPILLAILGAIIGLIISKIKSKKSS